MRPALRLAVTAVAVATALQAGDRLAAQEPGPAAAIRVVPRATAVPIGTAPLSLAPDPRAADLATRLAAHLTTRPAAPAGPPTGQQDALARLRQRVGNALELRLRPHTGTPRLLRGPRLEPRARGLLAWGDPDQRTARTFLETNRALLRLDDPDRELTLVARTRDDLGRRHLRFAQRHHGIPVWPADVVVHLDAAGDVDAMSGAFVPTPTVPTDATVSAAEAIARARDAVPGGADTDAGEPALVVYAPGDRAPRLGWKIELTRGLDVRWLAVVDARSGETLTTIDMILSANVAGSGVDGFGVVRPLNVWQENGTHFLVDTSKAMFDPSSDPPSPSTTRGGIVILDARNAEPDAQGRIDLFQVTSVDPNAFAPPDGVSAAFGLSDTYDYYLARLARNSLDGQGGTMIGIIRFSQNFQNAFWNGSLMVFGDGLPFARALDVVAHELTHGVTQFSANLAYQDQSGALNEAMSDILGETVEAARKGGPNFLIGEDLGAPFRNMANPGALTIADTGRPYPSRLSEIIAPGDPFLAQFQNRDNGGVHLNSGIVNRAFYLLAAGLPGAIGIDDAARVFYRALTVHLVANSQFVDARLACVQSARELFGAGSAQEQRVGEAFDAVEFFDGGGTPPPPPFPGTSGTDSTLFAFDSGGTLFLGRREDALADPPAGTQVAGVPLALERPAVAGDGSFAAVVSVDNDICIVNTDGSGEQCLGFTGEINSVAVSPDGLRFGVVLRDQFGPKNTVNVLDVTAGGSAQTFPLRAPTLDGGGLDTVLFADAMEFTADNRFLVYDALNQIELVDADPVAAWSIYALDVANDTTLVVVPPTPGFDIAFPSLSQTSDAFITFDTRPDGGDSTIVAADWTTGQLTPVATVPGAFGAPGYTGDDGAIVFNVLDATPTGFSLQKQPLAGDRATPSGTPTVLLQDARFGAIYRRGTFQGPTTTTTTLPPRCFGDVFCDDGDPCTDDVCDAAVGCANTAAAGARSASCVFGYGTADAACAGDAGFGPVSARLGKARDTIARADGLARKRAKKLLRKGSAQLRKADRLAAKLLRKGQLSDGCRAAVGNVTSDVRSRIAALLHGGL